MAVGWRHLRTVTTSRTHQASSSSPAGYRVVLFTTFLSQLYWKVLPNQNIILEQLPPGESFSAVPMSVSRFQIVRRNGNLTQKQKFWRSYFQRNVWCLLKVDPSLWMWSTLCRVKCSAKFSPIWTENPCSFLVKFVYGIKLCDKVK